MRHVVVTVLVSALAAVGLSPRASAAPAPAAGEVRTWVQVSAGDGHACGVKSDYTLWCWGEGSDGQLGDGLVSDHASPTLVP